MTEEELTAQAAVLQNAASALEQEAGQLELQLAQLENLLRAFDLRTTRQRLAQARQVAASTKAAVRAHFDQQAIAQLEERARITAGRQAWEAQEITDATQRRTQIERDFRR